MILLCVHMCIFGVVTNCLFFFSTATTVIIIIITSIKDNYKKMKRKDVVQTRVVRMVTKVKGRLYFFLSSVFVVYLPGRVIVFE